MATLVRDQIQIQGQFNTNPAANVVSGNRWIASNFTPGVTGDLNKVYVVIRKEGTPGGNLVVRVRATSGGQPTGADLASQSIAAGSITTDGILTVTFSSPATLTSGTKYALLFQCDDGLGGSPSAVNGYNPAWSVGDFYGSSITDYSSNDGGSTWSNNSANDAVFVTEMDTPVPTPGVDQFCYCTSNDEFINSGSIQISQTFQPSVTADLKKLRFHLYRIDGQTGGNVEFHIQGVGMDGKPDGTSIASQTVADTSIPSTSGTSKLDVTFTTPATLTASTSYAIVIKFPNASGSARYDLFVSPGTVNNYPSGQAWKSTNNGSTWANGTFGADEDLGFATFMLEPTTVEETIDSDATVQLTSEEEIDSDSFVGQETTQTINSDGTVFIEHTETILSDAFHGAITTQTIQSDASVGATISEIITSDAFHGAEASQTILSDSHIQAETTQTINSDLHIFLQTEQPLLADTTILAYVSQTLNAAATIAISIEQTLTSQAVIIVREPELKFFVVI